MNYLEDLDFDWLYRCAFLYDGMIVFIEQKYLQTQLKMVFIMKMS